MGNNPVKNKVKIYLDTSVISALFDDKNPVRKGLTRDFFRGRKNINLYISEITVAEIEKTPLLSLRENMKKVATGLWVLPVTDAVETLAREYLHQGAIPPSYPEDAYHIAVAVLNKMDYLLSWNFRHLVRKKTRDIVQHVNTLKGLTAIDIMTPAELL